MVRLPRQLFHIDRSMACGSIAPRNWALTTMIANNITL
jgi:hypothetical protein